MNKLKKVLIFLVGVLDVLYSYEIYLDAEKKYKKETAQVIKIAKEDIISSNRKNIFEVLEFYGLDIYRRSDAQVDIGLNSSSFEQVKVYINGIPVNDPQTGHHNCNIPINVEDIEYVEIIRNDNFAKFGNNAFGGVINIVTKNMTKNKVELKFGSFNTFLLNTNFSYNNSIFSFNYSQSDGFKENTDYKFYNIFSNFEVKGTKIMYGFVDKKFGAQDFYTTPSTRKEYEQTKTMLAAISKDFWLKDNFILESNLYLRNGYDFYTTMRYTPQIYSNYHNSYVFGNNYKFTLTYDNLKLKPFLELSFKYLDSKGYSSLLPSWKGLGEFSDGEYRGGLNFELAYKKLFFELTAALNYLTRYNFIPQGGLKINFTPKQNIELFSSVSYVFRTPSYTELYYWDPAHEGSEGLKVEKTLNYNLGFSKNFSKNIKASLAAFLYEPTNAIDWTRTKNSTESWKVTNIAKVETCGVNFALYVTLRKLSLNLNYTYTYKSFEIEPTKELKYIENYPKNNLSVVLSLPEIYGFRLSLLNKYKELTKTNPKNFWLADFVISKNYKNLNFTASVENLFDIKYEEIPKVTQPPRSFFVSINYFYK